jgi:hypothetical protein
MKTSIDMLKTIPDSIIRKQAMHNLLIQHDKKVIVISGNLVKINKFSESATVYKAINKFSWINSIEGQDYWEDNF